MKNILTMSIFFLMSSSFAMHDEAHFLFLPTTKENNKNPMDEASEVDQKRSNVDDNMCDITGLDKVDVLEALFNNARPGIFFPFMQKIARNQIAQALEKNAFDIDYLGGKPLKVNLAKNSFNAYLYNRDNGEGQAQKAIAKLRENKK